MSAADHDGVLIRGAQVATTSTVALGSTAYRRSGAADQDACADVRMAVGEITAIAPSLDRRPGERVIDAAGAALIPGLHDHHLHVIALAIADQSLVVGPPTVFDATGLRTALLDADARLPAAAWIRGVGFHESVHADLDRWWLDRVIPNRPVRIQHRSGVRWILNTAALDAVDARSLPDAGVERDAAGGLTGRLTGLDDELRSRWRTSAPDPEGGGPTGIAGRAALGAAVAAASRRLAAFGVTGVTDATPYARIEDAEPLLAGVRDGAITQRVTMMGAPGIDVTDARALGIGIGPAKIVVGDHDLPDFDDLANMVAHAHTAGRPVAIHCVTQIGIVLALAALDEVGSIPGDRIEHAAVVDAPTLADLVRLGVTVVTQPNFVTERGDAYLADVDPADLGHLYRCGGLLHAGIATGGSTDAPFGHCDPWRAMNAAVERRTPGGHVLAPDERIDALAALRLFLGSAAAPGGPARVVRVGAVADVCLLDRPLAEVLTDLSAERVRATFVGGASIYER